jgi:hypothetical protein
MVNVKNRVPELDERVWLTAEWLLRAAGLLDTWHREVYPAHMVAVKQCRGRCYYARSRVRPEFTITIPVWALNSKRDGFADYYVAHEMSHAFAWQFDGERQHGPAFMKWLKTLCPREFWHYELEYKPRNAMAAGIRKPKGEL